MFFPAIEQQVPDGLLQTPRRQSTRRDSNPTPCGDASKILPARRDVRRLSGLSWHEETARRFDEAARTVLTEAPSRVLDLRDHADFAQSVPTPDHFIPLLYIAGLADAAQRPLEPLVQGCAFGSVSMASYTLDAQCPVEPSDTGFSAGVPDPSIVSAEDANV